MANSIPSTENLSKWRSCKDKNSYRRKSHLPCECKKGYERKTKNGECERIQCKDVIKELYKINKDKKNINWNYYKFDHCEQRRCNKVPASSHEPCIKVSCNQMPKGSNKLCHKVPCDQMPKWNRSYCIPMCRNVPLSHTGFNEKTCACDNGYAPSKTKYDKVGKCVKARSCSKNYTLVGSIEEGYECVRNY